MRTAFVNTLVELANKDSRIWLLTGDLGYSVLEPFRDRYPARFVNVGVAEQNLIGVAAGLALTGKIVFTYSIVNFPVMRALEQIRNDVAYHNLPVVIAIVGGGMAYGTHGYTHHGVEDIGVMRLMPNMKILVPADAKETDWATRQLVQLPGPAYLRLARGGEPDLHSQSLNNHALGHPIELRHGQDVTIAACGPIVGMACAAAARLQQLQISASVFSVPSLMPFHGEVVMASARRTGRLLVLEEHGPGGLATLFAETLASQAQFIRMQALNYQPSPMTIAGSQDYLRSQNGLTIDAVISAAQTLVCG